MIRTTSKVLLSLTLVLLIIGIVQGVWIYKQQQQINLLQVTHYRNVFGIVEETINEVDRFANTQDRAVLENLYVRLTFLEREVHRAVELTHAATMQMKATTPSGLVDLIQLWRDLFQLADQKHQEWNLP